MTDGNLAAQSSSLLLVQEANESTGDSCWCKKQTQVLKIATGTVLYLGKYRVFYLAKLSVPSEKKEANACSFDQTVN